MKNKRWYSWLSIAVLSLICLLIARLLSHSVASYAQEPSLPFPTEQPTVGPKGGQCITPVWPDNPPAACQESDSDSINVCAPDIGGISQTRVNRYIWVSGLTDETSPPINAWTMTLTFSETVLSPVGIVQADTLSDGWNVLAITNTPGEMVLDATSTTPITRSGRLISLTFDVTGGTGSTTNLHISDLRFNDGDPPATLYDGSFSVVTAMEDYTCRCFLPLIRSP